METLDTVRSDLGRAFEWAPNEVVSLIIFGAALVLAWALHRLLFGLLTRRVRHTDLFWRSLVRRTRRLGLLLLLVLAVGFASSLAPLGVEGTAVANHVMAIFLIGAVAVAIHTAMNIWMTIHLRRFKLDSEDNLLARKHITQINILRRVADTLLTVIAIGAMLMTFEGVRQYGISLLASAGAAGLVVGLALQPFLKNLFAGIQLALTQPIRIDDAVLVEGEWGNVEEITSTYVVVRIWDWRRLIVPLSYFIEQPFQNWTRESAGLIGNVILNLDYRAPMDAIRSEVERIVNDTPLWDRKVVNVQVTDAQETTMQVRILATARNAAQTWDLRCLVRERIIGFLQREHPEALPRTRTQLDATPEVVARVAVLGNRAAQ